MSIVLDFYRAKAKQIINKEFAKYGELPVGMVVDIIFILLNSQRSQLYSWMTLRDHEYECTPMRQDIVDIAVRAINEHQRLISALDSLYEEYKLKEQDDTPCKSI